MNRSDGREGPATLLLLLLPLRGGGDGSGSRYCAAITVKACRAAAGK